MAADYLKIEIRISHAWWWKWYVRGVTATCLLTNSEPDLAKSLYWEAKARRVYFNGKRIKS